MIVEEMWEELSKKLTPLKETTQYNMKIAYAAGVYASALQLKSKVLKAAACKLHPELIDVDKE